MEDFVTIRNLKHKSEGKLSNRKIAEMLHISHNTVKKALECSQYNGYKRQSVTKTEIELFKDYIEEGLFRKKLRCSRILCDIQSKGYKGSKSAFYRYTSTLKPAQTRTFKPYETNPGEQSQFDWSPYTVVINGVLTVVYVFSYIFGYSRYRIYEASLSQTFSSVIDALETSILESGGVTSRIQTDNAGCFRVKAGKNDYKWNPRYLQFCGHYRIEPTRSLVRHPWSKGKVERPFDYLENHFIKGNEFSSFDEFCQRLKIFQEEVNNRVHLTTKQPPKVLFEKELSSLGCLPSSRFVDIKEEVRKASSDCLISFNGSRYSIPSLFANKEVWLKVSKGRILQIYSNQNNLIAEHVLSLEKGKIIMKEEHYNNHHIERGNWNRLSQKFAELFPEHEWFLDKLKIQKKINPGYHLTRIMEISKYYCKGDMIKAFNLCDKYNCFTYYLIKGHVENHGSIEEIVPIPIDKSVLNSIESVNILRPLSDYKLDYYQQLSEQSNYAEQSNYEEELNKTKELKNETE